MDLRKPLKRGTIVKYQGRNLKVFFKYERLPTFCFVCGKIGHLIKDCDEMEGKDETEFDDLEEKELPFGQWLRASPLPKFNGDMKRENSSGSCSKTLFAAASNSKEGSVEGKSKEKEVEVDQEIDNAALPLENQLPSVEPEKSSSEVESVAESLGNVVISPTVPSIGELDRGSHTKPITNIKTAKTWARKKGDRKTKGKDQPVLEGRKRQLEGVKIVEGDPMELCGGEQKRRTKMTDKLSKIPEWVLEDQLLLPQ